MSTHKFVHVELSSANAEAMKKFYGDAFNWEFMDFPEMQYTTFRTGEGGLGGGLSQVSENNPAGTVLLYIHTDDLAASVQAVKDAGGTVVMESFEIETVGTMALFTDPSGNQLALLQPAMEG